MDQNSAFAKRKLELFAAKSGSLAAKRGQRTKDFHQLPDLLFFMIESQ